MTEPPINIDRSDIYRVIEKFSFGNSGFYDTIKGLQKINSTDISTNFVNQKITIMFSGFDFRSYMVQSYSETGFMPPATFEIKSSNNVYDAKTVSGEAVDENKEKAMSKAYANTVHKSVQNLFEDLFGYKPYSVKDGFANGGRIYGDALGTLDFKPNILFYEANKDKHGYWHVRYKAEISFKYDTGIWRQLAPFDTFCDPLKNLWEYQEDTFWHLVETNYTRKDSTHYIIPNSRPYLLSAFTTSLYN